MRNPNRVLVARAAGWLAALLVAAALTVAGIALGWLPLCHKAAGLSTLALGVVLASLFELRHRRRRA